MTTVVGYFDRKPSSSIRPGLSHLQPDPSSPHTPQRAFSSTFSSPALSYRTEEEALIFELGNRHLSVGIAGDSCPRLTSNLSPNEGRRVGDYRQYLLDDKGRAKKRKRQYTWGQEHELWRYEMRNVDLGLVEDKIERALREAYAKYLLLDPKNNRKLVLVLPSLIPHRLLSTILSTFFNNLQNQSITLLSTPLANTVAAGCRSALVVDIGWSETIITAVYELREAHVRRTSRAMLLVTQRMGRILRESDAELGLTATTAASIAINDWEEGSSTETDSRYFEKAEEVTSRMAWCPTKAPSAQTTVNASNTAQELSQLNPALSEDTNLPPDSEPNPQVSIPSVINRQKSLHIPFTTLASPIETGLLATDQNPHDLDDHEQTLVQLMYKTLLFLPPDIRATCMSRIIITGGGSHIPGLKPRLLHDLSALIDQRGWDPVCGRVADELKTRHLKEPSGNRRQRQQQEQHQPAEPESTATTPAAFQPQILDPISQTLQHSKAKTLPPQSASVSGQVRGVETLGPWAGASLLVHSKIKGVVEVDKDSFLQFGLAGARKEGEAKAAAQRGSLGAKGVGDTGWTLGGWA